MKRLTISMSDELFDKLGVIDNKSLFIRKLIERELDILDNSSSDDIVSWTDRFAILRDDVNTILNRLSLVENSFTGINEISGNIQSAPQSMNIQEPAAETFVESNQTIREIHSEEKNTDIDIIDEFGETDVQLQPQISENEIPLQTPVIVAPEISTKESDEQEPLSGIQQSFKEEDNETNLSGMIAEKSSHEEMETSALKTETTAPAPPAQVMEQTNQEPAFTMPELKPPELASQDTGLTMPELKASSDNPVFTMPDFNLPAESPQVETTPVIPDFKLAEGMPPFNPESENTTELAFKLPEPQQPANSERMPPFMSGKAGTIQEMQNIPAQAPASPPATEQPSDTKQDKLEGNILMYMPRGAKVKKEIIKSLVSRKFSQEDIDRKIQELVTREVLVLKQENGIEQLHRLK